MWPPVYYSPPVSSLSMAGDVAAEASSGDLHYWLRWQVFVCAFVFLVPAVVVAALLVRARRRAPRATDLWRSCWTRVHPGWLLAYRTVVLLVMSGWLLRVVVMSGFRVFYFYTQWTFALVIIYFAIATVISAHGCWVFSKQQIMEVQNGGPKADIECNNRAALTFKADENKVALGLLTRSNQDIDEIRAGFWGCTMLIIYETCAGAVMLTDATFWAILVPFMSRNRFKVNLIMGGMHSLNAVFLLFDTVLNRLQLPFFGIVYFILWSCIYITFQWIIHACGVSWWPYPFLDLNAPWAVAWYLAMTLVHIPCYGLYWLIVRAKDLHLPRFFPNAYISSH